MNLMKSLFTICKQGHLSSMDLQCSTQCTVAITALASIELLGGCEVCNKLRALCVTPPIITFRGSHNKVVPSLPVPSSVCRYLCYGMEIGDGSQDYAKLQNSIILPLTLCETQPAACRYITQLLNVLQSD